MSFSVDYEFGNSLGTYVYGYTLKSRAWGGRPACHPQMPPLGNILTHDRASLL